LSQIVKRTVIRHTRDKRFFQRPRDSFATTNERQFFIVFKGLYTPNAHVAVGVFNKGNSTIFDPQSGETFKRILDFGDIDAAVPILLK